MTYTTVTGNGSNNFMTFVGVNGQYVQTLINPYTGYTITIDDVKSINNAIYDGRGGTDTLSLSIAGDVLSLLDAAGTIMITSIEIINASQGGDIINFAFDGVTYGNVIIRGAEGDDIIWGNNGDDSLNGASGSDNLIGGGGHDTIFGGADDDYVDGGTGADYVTGGAGNDQLIYTADAVWSGGLTLANLGSSLSFAALIALDGKNQSFDTFNGDANDDGTITTPAGYDVLTMTAGSDVLVATDLYSVQNAFGAGQPRVAYVDQIDAGAGDDVVDLSGGVATGPVTVNGGDGNDVLAGNGDADTLNGDDGNDILSGGAGDDLLNGGTGDDVYYYGVGDGSDTITETAGADTIVFGAGITLNDVTLTVVGSNLLLTLGGDTITIVNHYAADLSGRVETLTFDDGSVFNLGAYVPNEAPAAQDDSFTVYRDTVLNGNVLVDNGTGADTDADGNTLTVQPQTLTTANGGVVVLQDDGSFSYTPADHFIGGDNFTYTIDDGHGGTDTATVSLNVGYKLTDSVGTNGDDTLDGTSANDTMFALDGDDVIKGQDGNDEIYGGGGNDFLYGDDSILTGTTYDKYFNDTITAPNVKEGVAIQNLNPSGIPALGIAAGNLSVDFDATATITFRKGYAGHDNSFGAFGLAADGTITTATMEWANVKTAGIDTAHTIDIPVGANGGAFGFFIIDDGNNANGGYRGLDMGGEGNIHFVYNYGHADARDAKITDAGSKVSVVYDDGVTTKLLNGNVYFTTERGESVAANEDGKTHVVSGLMENDHANADIPGIDHNTLRIGFEDLYNTGDADYEDVLFDLDINAVHVGDTGGGNDFLDGGAGNDFLYGEGGNDILVLGLGGDHAFGGEGADIFALTLVDGLVDTIHDFSAAQGDSINIADVLEGYDPLADDIANFVHLVQNGGDTELQINADGDAGGAFVTAALIIGGTGGDDLAALLDSGHLVADHSALA